MKKFILSSILILTSLLSAPSVRAAEEVPKDSLFLLQSHWKNQDGLQTTLKSFAGIPVIIAMTYTGCQYSCPLTLNKLAEIEKDLKKRGVQHYQIVTASFDPVRDKPEVLKPFMTKRKLDPAHWTLLSPQSDSDVRELAVLLNVSYQKMENGEFSHSNGIALLDPQGRLALQLKGLASDHKELVDKVVSYEKQN